MDVEYKLNRQRRWTEQQEYLTSCCSIVHQIPRVFRSSRWIIDLGPGAGELLEHARLLGYQIQGIDSADDTGGMSKLYRDVCRQRWHEHSINVMERDAIAVFRSYRLHPIEQPDWHHNVQLLNSRGSFEYIFRHYLEPHTNAWMTCEAAHWQFTNELREDLQDMFAFAHCILCPDGWFVLHANGCANHSLMDHELQSIGNSYLKLTHCDQAKRLYRWKKS